MGNFSSRLKEIKPIVILNSFPYKEIEWCKFNNKLNYDRIYLTKSPSFTPTTSDNLISVISKYIKKK